MVFINDFKFKSTFGNPPFFGYFCISLKNDCGGAVQKFEYKRFD